jgi:hypothetical protein
VSSPRDRTSPAGLVVAAAVYTAITVWVLWPLPTMPGRVWWWPRSLQRVDQLLHVWIMRWDLHALAHAPQRLLDGNIFHPAPRMLLGSDHLLGNLPVFAPAWALSGNPILGLNAMTFASFVLGGLFMHALVLAWTGSTPAAYVAGIAFAFAPWRAPAGILGPHLLQVQYFPLCLLGIERTIATGRSRTAIATAAVIALQALCAYYVAYQLFTAIALFVLVRLVAGRGGFGGARLRALAVALGFPFAVMVVSSVPYLLARRSGDLDFAWPAEYRSLLGASVATTFREWVGWGPLVLAVPAIAVLPRAWRVRDPNAVRTVGLVVIAAMAVFLARGPAPVVGAVVPYDWIERVVPGFANLRVYPRWASLASFALSALAGLGVAVVVARVRPAAARGGVAALAAAALLVHEVPARGVAGWAVPADGEVPPVYRWLAQHGDGGPLLEVSGTGVPEPELFEVLAMYYSTYHWLPILNGYTGYAPPSHDFVRRHAAELPDADALTLLRDCTGVRWVLVHELTPTRAALWDRLGGVERRGAFPRPPSGEDVLYEVVAPVGSTCPGGLFDPARTVEGHPIDRAPTTGDVALDGLDDPAPAGGESRATLVVRNGGSATWPCTAVRAPARVSAWLEWAPPAGIPPPAEELLLPHDVAPDERATFRLWIRHPPRPATYRVRVRIGRAEAATTDPEASFAARVVAPRTASGRGARDEQEGAPEGERKTAVRPALDPREREQRAVDRRRRHAGQLDRTG